MVASKGGNLVVLNTSLDIVKEFDGSDSSPLSISGNTSIIAFGDFAGVVRYYRRDGDKRLQV